MNKNIIVVGSGISGLYSSLLLRFKYPKSDIYIIEATNNIGGLLKSFRYDNHTVFDHGIHTHYETGINEIDSFFYNLLQPNEWNELTDYMRDYGGNYFKKLNIGSPYVDCRVFDIETQSKFLWDMLNTKTINNENVNSAYKFAVEKFGTSITDNVITPIVEKFSNNSIRETHNLALKILPLDRIVLLDLETILNINSRFISSRIGFPDQLSYPREFLPNKKSIYPKYGGIQTLVDRLEMLLDDKKIKILKNTKVDSIFLDSKKIYSCNITKENIKSKIEDIEIVCWNAGLSSLPKAINHSSLIFDEYSYDPPQKTVLVNLTTREKPSCHGLFYTFVFEEGFKTHRVTNYYNFNPESVFSLGYPICLEMIARPSDNIDSFKSIAIEELIKIGMISDPSMITFMDMRVINGGYPSLSIRNIKNIDSIREDVLKYFPETFYCFGMLSKSNVFFQPEILCDIYNTFSKC